jgi:hypothetical protein
MPRTSLPTTLAASDSPSSARAPASLPPPVLIISLSLITGFGDLDGGYTEAKKQTEFRRKRRLKPHPFFVPFRFLIS